MTPRSPHLQIVMILFLFSFIFALSACQDAEDIQQTRTAEQAAADQSACNDIQATRVSTIARCHTEAAAAEDAQECIIEAETYFNDWAAQNQCDLPAMATTSTPTVTPTALDEPTVTATPAASSLTYQDARGEVAECEQEQAGDFFELTCDFNVVVEVDYEVPGLPAFFFCRARVRGVSGVSAASVELGELSGMATLTVPVTGVRKLYEDDDQNGAADLPVDDGDNMFTNPDRDNDGIYVTLSCAVGEFDFQDNRAWNQFECLPPDSEEPSDCLAPWLSRADAHAWD